MQAFVLIYFLFSTSGRFFIWLVLISTTDFIFHYQARLVLFSTTAWEILFSTSIFDILELVLTGYNFHYWF